MSLTTTETKDLLPYTVWAHNTSADSENKIHDDAVAAEYGFRGGLVPGIAVYAYMTVPVVEGLGPEWLERGSMHVRFHKPFYEGDRVTVRRSVEAGSMTLTAERDEGVVAATASAALMDASLRPSKTLLSNYPDMPLPAAESRLPAAQEHLTPGLDLGTLKHRLDFAQDQAPLLEKIGERLLIYGGSEAVAHPYVLLALANRFLMQNVKLGPWIHTESDLTNWSVARDGEEIAVRGHIAECYERKSHEFVVLDLLLACGDRIVQQVRHTAIYRIRPGPIPAA
jgi:acyl dehydratase